MLCRQSDFFFDKKQKQEHILWGMFEQMVNRDIKVFETTQNWQQKWSDFWKLFVKSMYYLQTEF